MKALHKSNRPGAPAAVAGLLAAVTLAGSSLAAGLLPLQPGMTAVTCGPGVNPAAPYVVAVFDTRGLAAQPTGQHWPAPASHNELAPSNHIWNVKNLGTVFGICLDNAAAPNIYVTACSFYSLPSYGPMGQGGVYKLDGNTGAITQFHSLTSGPASLGNICYDPVNRQLLVSELDYGIVHALDTAGNHIGAFDHGVKGRPNESLPPITNAPSAGLTQGGRRVFGLQVRNGRLYYGVWNDNAAGEIWSVGLTGPGSFNLGNIVSGGPRRELTMPGSYFNNPVTDIAFSDDGHLFAAERTISQSGQNLYSGSHQARLLEFVPAGSGWTTNSNVYSVGAYSQHQNSAGGVDVDCDGRTWVTADAINYPTPSFYGLQIIPPGGNGPFPPSAYSTIASSHIIDFDGNTNEFGADKGSIGCVEIMRNQCQCLQLVDERVQCTGSNQFAWTFSFTNKAAFPVGHFVFVDLPTGASVVGGPLVSFDPPVLPGDGATVTVNFSVPAGTTNFCIRFAAHNPDFSTCCFVEKCFDTLPDCCGIILQERVICSKDPNGTLTYQFTLQNLSGVPVQYVYLAADPGCVSPAFQFQKLTPALPNGASNTFSFNFVSTNRCAQACFTISMHDTNFQQCCSFHHCVALPDCGPVVVITNPPNGGVVIGGPGISIPVEVAPLDPKVRLRSVSVMANGLLLGSSDAAPYVIAADLSPGTHILQASALYESGALGYSENSVVMVIPDPANQGGGPILRVKRVPGGIQLNLRTVAGEVCYIEANNGTQPQAWRMVEVMIGDGREWQRIVPANQADLQFFRVRMP